MSMLKALQSAHSLSDVAVLFGRKPARLSHILYKTPPAAKYNTFEIPKRSGGLRTICAPTPQLKRWQTRLAAVLQECMSEIDLAHGRCDTVSHGFMPERTIITNALGHRRRRYVFNVDLEDFFGAINFGRVRGFFIKDRSFGLDPRVATVLAQIACHNNQLPQGSPCSPVISNLIGRVLDSHLVRLARRQGCHYTRYADDLTFSTNQDPFPPAVAVRDSVDPHSWRPGTELEALVRLSGFTLNAKKTRMQYRDSRQEVTGLVVNRKVNVRADYRHRVRAMVNRLVTTGTYEHVTTVDDGVGPPIHKTVVGTLDALNGMLGFIDWVDRSHKERGTRRGAVQSKRELSSKERLYRRFIMYKELYASTRPLLIFEGGTDYVYLLHAIRSLVADYPTLAAKDAGGKISLVPRLFKYRDRGVSRILEVGGGVGHLAKLMHEYMREVPRFAAPGPASAVILVIDNDQGRGTIFQAVYGLTKKRPTGMETFIHVGKNLYVVTTPIAKPADMSRIEDLFDPSLLGTVIDGKKFEPDEPDPAAEYGKVVFAHKVVRANADSIDFEGFKPLLERIAAALAHFGGGGNAAGTGSSAAAAAPAVGAGLAVGTVSGAGDGLPPSAPTP